MNALRRAVIPKQDEEWEGCWNDDDHWSLGWGQHWSYGDVWFRENVWSDSWGPELMFSGQIINRAMSAIESGDFWRDK